MLYTSSSTSFGTYISDNHIEYHFHLLSQPHPCRIHAFKEIFRTQKFDFVHKNRRFVLSPEKIIYLLPTSTTIYLLPRTWAAHYNQLEQTSVIFMGGIIKWCITIIVRSKLSCLIFLFINLLTSTQTPIIIV